MGRVNHEPCRYLPQAALAILDLEYHMQTHIINLIKKQSIDLIIPE